MIYARRGILNRRKGASSREAREERLFAYGGDSGKKRLELRLDDFAATQAGGADAQALGSAIDLRAHRAEVHVPATLGDVMRVADVVPELRPFAAHFTNLCHDYRFLSTQLAKT